MKQKLLLAASVLLLSLSAQASTRIFAWDFDTTIANADGFTLYSQEQLPAGQTGALPAEKVFDFGATATVTGTVGAVKSFSLSKTDPEWTEGKSYSFTLTAYRTVNGIKSESARSNVVLKAVPVTNPGSPVNLRVQ